MSCVITTVLVMEVDGRDTAVVSTVLVPETVGVIFRVDVDVMVTVAGFTVAVTVQSVARQLQTVETTLFFRRQDSHWPFLESPRAARPPGLFRVRSLVGTAPASEELPRGVARLFFAGDRVTVTVSKDVI